MRGHSTAMRPPVPGTTYPLVTRRLTATGLLAGIDQLVTGEAVALELPPASLGVRVLSGLIDLAIQCVLLILGFILAALLAPDDALFARRQHRSWSRSARDRARRSWSR